MNVELEARKARSTRGVQTPEDKASDAAALAKAAELRKKWATERLATYATQKSTEDALNRASLIQGPSWLSTKFQGPAIPKDYKAPPQFGPPIQPSTLIPKAALDAAGQEAGASAGQATGTAYKTELATAGAGAAAQAQAIGQQVKAALEVTATPRIVMPTAPATPAAPALPMAGQSYGRGPQPPRKASGGRVGAGEYWVGEKGPEIFRTGMKGSITPTHKLAGGKSVVHHNTFNITGNDTGAIVREVARLFSTNTDSGFRAAHADLGPGFV
jgi:hypothetical protein